MLDMEGHGNDDVATCPVKQLYYKEVADMLEKGMNKEEILAYYVDQMGEQALKAPSKKGFSLFAWTIPYVVLFIAALFVYYVIRKWKIKNKEQQNQHVKTKIPNETERNSLIDFIERERKKYF
ncbi:cytochrome c-type biogenesis protein CcmH [Bacillus sp. P2(2020)]|uniref:Cytochrome c-type biogenesis protein n=2 Tax=Calidifontibacillus erzurumensis TaxID=2741433 RepID=A0A8J8K9X6_9BACI|nr:cytochrome c-type biogenesis protein CcmH [Calidifontibacillus erzurumensis]